MMVIDGDPGPGRIPCVVAHTSRPLYARMALLVSVSGWILACQTPAGPGAPCMYSVCPEQKLDASEAKNSTP